MNESYVQTDYIAVSIVDEELEFETTRKYQERKIAIFQDLSKSSFARKQFVHNILIAGSVGNSRRAALTDATLSLFFIFFSSLSNLFFMAGRLLLLISTTSVVEPAEHGFTSL